MITYWPQNFQKNTVYFKNHAVSPKIRPKKIVHIHFMYLQEIVIKEIA